MECVFIFLSRTKEERSTQTPSDESTALVSKNPQEIYLSQDKPKANTSRMSSDKNKIALQANVFNLARRWSVQNEPDLLQVKFIESREEQAIMILGVT